MTQMNTRLQEDRRQRWMAFMHSLHPESDPHAIRLMDEMRMVSHTLYQIGERSVTDAGLSFAQYRILLSLLFADYCGENDGLNPSEISERQGTSRNTISALIRNLEEEGLVERQLDQNDRRKFNIRLTLAGRALAETHASQHLQTIGDCFEALSADEQETLSHLLNKVAQRANRLCELYRTSPARVSAAPAD